MGTLLKGGLLVVMCVISGNFHVQYARANYPQSKSWQLLLFIIGFLIGALAIWALIPGNEVQGIIAGALVGGIPFGLVSLWWFPQKMQTIVPKK